MTGFKYNGQRVDNNLAEEIGKLLDHAGVPNYVWGEIYLTLIAAPVVIHKLDFFVPDHLIDVAINTLRNADFPDDKDNPRCAWNKKAHEREGTWPIPYHMFHLEEDDSLLMDEQDEHFPKTAEDIERIKGPWHVDLFLYRKSDYFWDLPDIPVGLPAPDDPNFMLANDRRLPVERVQGSGDGRIEDPNCQLKIVAPPRYIESNLLLIARDRRSCDGGLYWAENLRFVIMYTTKSTADWSLTEPESLKPRFQRLWATWLRDHISYQESVFRQIGRLRAALLREGSLPSSPFPNRH
ncbi:hypothetical protein P170DRAFT_429337 [Aspergillus steynii IBT 23096]|uniref:Uncharacterized protein n=1 Tax=Aspergillus steynii IBT 23096 TaxID=1392250 RepID=A0A2I2FZZ8_9EURO|nr:uncharacterized protein P170DRAFT_429337 [Aspergillus steynii IBT 23096]PLB46200.1 hypothetical protein P170DRAFT_429337 [Aspergillus steynii IBT 23096]